MTAPAVSIDEALAAWHTPYTPTPYDLWTRTNVGEVFPGALTPLTYSVVDLLGQRLFATDPQRAAAIPPDLVRNGVLPAVFRVINGRMFYNTGLIHHLFTDRFGMPSWFWAMGLGGPQDPSGSYFEKKRFRPLRALRGLPYILRETLRQRRSIAAYYRDRARMAAQALTLAREPLADLDAEALVHRLERVIVHALPSQAQLLDGSAAAVSMFGLLAGLCGRWLGDPGIANDLVTGSGELDTANATLSLWDVATLARQNPAARAVIFETAPGDLGNRLQRTPGAREVARAYMAFLQDFGHRCVDEFELSTPRWSEQPDFPVATLRTYIDAAPELDPRAALARQQRRRKRATRAARVKLTRGLHGILPYRWLVLNVALRQAQALLPLRENPKHLFLRFLAEIRRTALAIGERLRTAGVIQAESDVFFLTRDELRVLAESATRSEHPSAAEQLIAERRRLYARFDAWSPPEVIPAGQIASVERAVQAEDVAAPAASPPTPPRGRQLSGLTASQGLVTGRARVALTAKEGAEIEPGEILVAPFTDPGWTPLFAVAGGIVMDLGGLLSHGAIVAREYGIPAVVNTRTATTMIQTGQQVTIDGETGTVTWEEADGSDD